MDVAASTRSSRSHSTSSVSNQPDASSYPHSNADDDAEHLREPDDSDLTQDQDVAMAIAALGLMRRGSSTDGAAFARPPLNQYHPPPRPPTITTTASSVHSWRSPPGTSYSTGASSPVGPASLTPGSEADFNEQMDAHRADQHGWEGSEEEGAGPGAGDPRFMKRVSQLPIVSGGLEWYERSKASSRVVKYGAGLVESSISAVSRPLANNLQLGQLDEFACRQLDRLGATTTGSSPSSNGYPVASSSSSARDYYTQQHHLDAARYAEERESEARERGEMEFQERERVEREMERAKMIERERERAMMGTQQAVAVAGGGRSRWQTVLVEAGGLGAAVSEESLKSLRYCLQWLLYATAHLDHQISILRDFIDSLHRHYSTNSSRTDALISASASADLTRIKHDVVETIRKVVDVVSKYAGAALPEQAKRYVKASILGLPVKWASAIQKRTDLRMAIEKNGPGVTGDDGVSSGGTPGTNDGNAEASGSGTTIGGRGAEEERPELRPTEEGAERILSFAVESLDMLRSVTQIFGESVEKAEAWIERLRVVGLDRQRHAAQTRAVQIPPRPVPEEDDEYEFGPSGGGYKRRKTSRDESGLSNGNGNGLQIGSSATTTGMNLGGMGGGDEATPRRKRIWDEEDRGDAPMGL